MSALKLFASGKAKPNIVDKQLKRHLLDGPVCQVMDEGLYTQDEAGLLAIINEDNLNSALDMPCNEMEILAFVSQEINATPACRLVAEEILSNAKTRFGSKAFSDQDLKCMYNYALMVPSALVRNLSELHFSMVPAAKLRCPPKIFNTIAGIDRDGMNPYTKVPIQSVDGEKGKRGGKRERER